MKYITTDNLSQGLSAFLQQWNVLISRIIQRRSTWDMLQREFQFTCASGRVLCEELLLRRDISTSKTNFGRLPTCLQCDSKFTCLTRQGRLACIRQCEKCGKKYFYEVVNNVADTAGTEGGRFPCPLSNPAYTCDCGLGLRIEEDEFTYWIIGELRREEYECNIKHKYTREENVRPVFSFRHKIRETVVRDTGLGGTFRCGILSTAVCFHGRAYSTTACYPSKTYDVPYAHIRGSVYRAGPGPVNSHKVAPIASRQISIRHMVRLLHMLMDPEINVTMYDFVELTRPALIGEDKEEGISFPLEKGSVISWDELKQVSRSYFDVPHSMDALTIREEENPWAVARHYIDGHPGESRGSVSIEKVFGVPVRKVITRFHCFTVWKKYPHFY